MKILLATIACFTFLQVQAQNHEENLRTIKTADQAKAYAADFREVSFSLINAEKDAMFFDDIDTSKLETYVGSSKSFFGRTTKLIEDTIVSLVNVQVITFDLTKMSKETAELLKSQMLKRLNNGETYWSLKKKYGHTSTIFQSSPEPVGTVTKKYGVKETDLVKGNVKDWEIVGSKGQIGILIVEKVPHNVAAFFAVSYLNLN
jgi:hypothetical protein